MKTIRWWHNRLRAEKKHCAERRKLLGGALGGKGISLKALGRGNNLAFSKGTCAEKKQVRAKMNPRKVEVGLKRRGQVKKERRGWKLA